MIRIANKAASKSTFARARVGAVIQKGGRVLSTGFNKYGTNKNLKNRNSEFTCTIHAEEAAIIPLLSKRKQHISVGATLHVSRILKNGKPTMAKPCATCTGLIRAVGIKRVFYTDNEGLTKEMEL